MSKKLEKLDTADNTDKKDNTTLADISGLASDMIDDMPEVQQHVINSEQHDELLNEYPELRDREGNSFDPAIHSTNPDGTPKLNSSGKLQKRRVSSKGNLTVPIKTTEEKRNIKEEARAIGSVAASFTISLGLMISDDFLPEFDEKTGVDERLQLQVAYANYFEATGKTDLPPGWALGIVLFTYASKRFVKPKTKSRIDQLKMWIGEKIGAMRGRKAAAPKTDHHSEVVTVK
jgi:hypothetical protein